ncbi:MAG: hypothetical protein KAI94_13755, partial [Anaerolineales bacterium]|nr:hypothetical protein [Anaerolineales bacterium]
MTLPSPKTIGPDPNKDYAKIGRSILLKRSASGTPTGIPEVTPWRPPRGWQNQNFPLPTAPISTPAERNINDMMKINPDWDYQNPMYKGVEGLGPNGEKLPEDALGWTPHATPYYGPGLEGWWKGTVSRLNAPISYEDETIIPQAEPGEDLPWYQKALGTLENLGARFYNAGGEEGGAITPGVLLTRGVSEGVKTLLDLAQVPSLGTERSFGLARTVEERYAEEFDLPEPEYKPFWEGYNPFQEFNSFTSPTGWAFKLGQMIGFGKLNTDETYDLLKEGWNTGRVFYSTVADPMVAEEYKRRYNDAEDPVLLGMELENPMAEMVGQIVLDPLNLLGLGARKLKDARKLTSAREDWFTLPKVIDDVLKAIGDVKSDSEAIGKIEELTGAVRQAFVDMKNSYKISSLTADGKRYIVTRKANELMQWTLRTNSGGDPEKAMDIIRGAIMLSSDDADEIATGISIIKNASSVSPSPYFSNA